MRKRYKKVPSIKSQEKELARKATDDYLRPFKQEVKTMEARFKSNN